MRSWMQIGSDAFAGQLEAIWAKELRVLPELQSAGKTYELGATL